MQLEGKTAIVTGSNSGIGLGIARALAEAGADVVLNSFTDNDDDHALAERLGRETGRRVRYIKADMSRPNECRALVEKAGACDILVNNAGIQHVAPVDQFPPEKWDAIIASHFSSETHSRTTCWIHVVHQELARHPPRPAIRRVATCRP